MNTDSIRSEGLKTIKRPLTLWVIGLLLAMVFIRPPIMAGLSRYFVIDTVQGLRIWAGPPYTAVRVLGDWMGTLIGGAAPQHVLHAVVVLVGYTLALSGLALASFRRQEFTA